MANEPEIFTIGTNEDQEIYPVTKEKAVYDDNGVRLDNKLRDLNNNLATLNNTLYGGSNKTVLANSISVTSYPIQHDGIIEIVANFSANDGNIVVNYGQLSFNILPNANINLQIKEHFCVKAGTQIEVISAWHLGSVNNISLIY